MNTIIALIAALCSLGFSLLAIASFALGMDTTVVGLLGFMALIATGHAVATAKF